jgi:hypothetical protein
MPANGIPVLKLLQETFPAQTAPTFGQKDGQKDAPAAAQHQKDAPAAAARLLIFSIPEKENSNV